MGEGEGTSEQEIIAKENSFMENGRNQREVSFDEKKMGEEVSEVWRRIKLPEGDSERDEEGALIFHGLETGFRESVKEESASGEISGETRFGTFYFTYKDACESLKKLDDPAEVNRAIHTLRLFHQQLGLEEYRVNIAIKEGISEEEKRSLIKEKIRQDIEVMPRQMAEHLMAGYVRQKAEFFTRMERLWSDLQSPLQTWTEGIEPLSFPSREFVREEATSLRFVDNRIRWEEERLLGKIGSKDLENKVREARERRHFFEEKKPPSLKGLGKEESNGLRSNFLSLLEKRYGVEGRQIFERLPEDEREKLEENAINKQLLGQTSLENLRRSLHTADPDLIVERLSDVKKLRLELKAVYADIRVEIAKKRSKDALDKLKEVARDIALGSKKESLLKDVWEAFPFVKEVIDAKRSKIFASAKKVITEVIDKTLAAGEEASDLLAAGLGNIEEGLDATVGKAANWVEDRLKSTTDELQASLKVLGPASRERMKYGWRREFYDKRHAIRVGVDKALTSARVQVEVGRRSARLIGRGLIGSMFGVLSEEDQKAFKRKRELLRKVASRPLRSAGLLRAVEKNGKTYAEKRKEVPEFEIFWREAEKYVNEVVKEVAPRPEEEVKVKGIEEDIPDVKEPAGISEKVDEASQEFKKRFPNIRDYEVLTTVGSDKETVIVMGWWDGENYILSRINDRGELLYDLGRVEAKDLEKAREIFERGLKGLEGENIRYERHQYFAFDQEGNLELVKGKSSDFWRELIPEENQILSAAGADLEEKSEVLPVGEAGKEPEKFLGLRSGMKGHEVIKWTDREGNIFTTLIWWDESNNVFDEIVDGEGKILEGDLSRPFQARTDEEIMEYIEELIRRLRSQEGIQEVKRGFYFSKDPEGKVFLFEPVEPTTDKAPKDKTLESEGEVIPEEITYRELSKSVARLAREKNRVKADYEKKMQEKRAQREDFETYYDAIESWEVSLYDLNDFINSKLPPVEREDLSGNKNFEKYIRLNQNLVGLQNSIRQAQSVEDQERLLREYRKLVSKKWVYFKRFRRQGLIK